MQDNFAVRVGLELVLGVKLFAQNPVVVNLAIDGQNDRFVLVGQGLSSTVYWNRAREKKSQWYSSIYISKIHEIEGETLTDTDDAKTFVGHNCPQTRNR